MTKYFVLGCLLTAITAASVRGAESGSAEIAAHLVKVGLALDDSDAAPANATADQSISCDGVSFSRSLKYGESDLNVLDVATGDSGETSPRPVLLFVAGESFVGESGTPDDTGAAQDHKPNPVIVTLQPKGAHASPRAVGPRVKPASHPCPSQRSMRGALSLSAF